jgi:predicted nucleotidyltransferase
LIDINKTSVLGGVRVDLIPAQDLKPDVRARIAEEAMAL